MWKWYCPASPMFINEHHTEEGANSLLLGHMYDGVPHLGVEPCVLKHEVPVDDGKPCPYPRCKIPYIRAVEDVD